jgi:hypothetical protein
MSPIGELAMFLALGLTGLGVFFGPVGAALGRRLSGGRQSEVRDEIEQASQRMAAEVDELRGRLAEVEERLDFAERLLTAGGHEDQIPGGIQR